MDLPRNRTFAGLMDEMAERYGERNFLTDNVRRLSYNEFRKEVRHLAKALYKLGVRKDTKVALIMGNQIEWVVIDFAVALLGGVLVGVNTWWKKMELEHALLSTDSSILIMVDQYLSNNYSLAMREIGDLSKALPLLKTIIGFGTDLLPGAMTYEALLKLADGVDDASIDELQKNVKPDDNAYLLFTSGSTARSKAVELTHRGCIENTHGIGERMYLTELDRMLMPTSMFWSLTCINGLFAVMTHGGSIVILFKYDIDDLFQTMERERCTGIYTLPNIALAMHAYPHRNKFDLSAWRTGTVRSGVIHLMHEMGAHEMISGYGLTEGYGHSCDTDARAPLATKMRNAGKPLTGVEIKITDPDTQQTLPRGTAGEILLRGYITPGYYKNPERTRETIDAEGWFHTGDVGVLEEDGSLTFRGRYKELIKTGGINVVPVDVEDVLHSHPRVRQAVVVGLPDKERDEIVAAMVVAHPGQTIDMKELLAHCKKSAAAFKIPRYVLIVKDDEVPLTDTGKVHRGKTQEILEKHYLASKSTA